MKPVTTSQHNSNRRSEETYPSSGDPFHSQSLRATAFSTIDGDDPHKATLVEQIIHVARQRGSLSAQLRLDSPANIRESVHERIAAINTELRSLWSDNSRLLTSDPVFCRMIIDVARRTENESRFLALATELYVSGFHVGESHGRTIHHKRLEKFSRQRDALLQTAHQLHPDVVSQVTQASRSPSTSSEPLDATSTAPAPTLTEALHAASQLGERDGISSRIRADVIATRIYRSIGGWRSLTPPKIMKDYEAVKNALSGLSRVECGLVETAFRELTGRHLKESLYSAFRNKAAHLFLQLNAEDARAAAIVVQTEAHALFRTSHTRNENIRNVYERLSAKEISAMEEQLSHTLPLHGRAVREYLAQRVSPVVAQQLDAYREGDRLAAQVLHVHDLLQSPKHQLSIRHFFASLDNESLVALEKRFQAERGISLRQAVLEALPESPARDLCAAILERDTRRRRAADVACALAYRQDFIGGPFLEVDADGRQALINDYEHIYGRNRTNAFWEDLKAASRRDDYFLLAKSPKLCAYLEKIWWPTTNSYPFLESIVKNGKLRPAELLRYFMVGLGTDVDGIFAVLSNRTRDNLHEIEADYARRYPPGTFTTFVASIPVLRNFFLIGNLRHDLAVELSGNQEFDAMELLSGLPRKCSKKELCAFIYDRLLRRKQHETSGILF